MITIHRVASVYPEEVAIILKKHGSKCRILNFEGVTIPTYLRFNSAPAILLDDNEFNEHDKYAVVKFGLKAYEGQMYDMDSRKKIRARIESI
ncbi:hypothetical protein AYI70_g5251 [Smittium culicis]|uniref:Uncharacterized protein n=1 Tax=Smittium culicis TaxID=133412 RepID=A0A1R1XVR1_9FUNG|nr:hypothetical protein AYI70_g10054 [Smittium culicis]OMJ18629.1 hypothetical protein AYI70_g5251 [Smittium culicis]